MKPTVTVTTTRRAVYVRLRPAYTCWRIATCARAALAAAPRALPRWAPGGRRQDGAMPRGRGNGGVHVVCEPAKGRSEIPPLCPRCERSDLRPDGDGCDGGRRCDRLVEATSRCQQVSEHFCPGGDRLRTFEARTGWRRARTPGPAQSAAPAPNATVNHPVAACATRAAPIAAAARIGTGSSAGFEASPCGRPTGPGRQNGTTMTRTPSPTTAPQPAASKVGLTRLPPEAIARRSRPGEAEPSCPPSGLRPWGPLARPGPARGLRC